MVNNTADFVESACRALYLPAYVCMVAALVAEVDDDRLSDGHLWGLHGSP